MGEFDRALRYADQGLEVAREIQNPFALAAAYHFRGEVHANRGAWLDALADYEEGQRVAERAGDVFRVCLV